MGYEFMGKYELMSNEELEALAKERYKSSGRFKTSAIRAQEELYNRRSWEVNEKTTFDDGFIERRIEERDYDGYDEYEEAGW